MDSTLDGIKQVTASGASYVELTLQDTTETCIKGVQAVVAQHKVLPSGERHKDERLRRRHRASGP